MRACRDTFRALVWAVAACTAPFASAEPSDEKAVQAFVAQKIALGSVGFSYLDNSGRTGPAWPVKSYKRAGKCQGALNVDGFSTSGFAYSPAWLVEWDSIETVAVEGRTIWLIVPLQRAPMFTFALTLADADAAAEMAEKLKLLQAACKG